MLSETRLKAKIIFLAKIFNFVSKVMSVLIFIIKIILCVNAGSNID